MTFRALHYGCCQRVYKGRSANGREQNFRSLNERGWRATIQSSSETTKCRVPLSSQRSRSCGGRVRSLLTVSQFSIESGPFLTDGLCVSFGTESVSFHWTIPIRSFSSFVCSPRVLLSGSDINSFSWW